MGLRSFASLCVFLLLSSQLFPHAKGDGGRSVVFLDSPDYGFLRGRSMDAGHESGEILLDDITAAAYVLLGFAPPISLLQTSASKLNGLLSPNPFNRPRAVLMVEVRGVEAPFDAKDGVNTFTYNIGTSEKEHIMVPDEDSLFIVPVDEPFGCVTCLDKEFAELALLLGGTYDGTIEANDGVLTFPLADSTPLVLHVSKQADLYYASSLASLVNGINKAAQMHEDFIESAISPAELLMGTFTGIEALNEYGPTVAERGVKVFRATLTKVFDLLQKHYGGKIVGIVIFNKEPALNSESIFDTTFTARSSRILQEVKGTNAIDPEVLLVRRSLAWITGIILVVATLIGTYLLLGMPLTRDTLLYANVKLD